MAQKKNGTASKVEATPYTPKPSDNKLDQPAEIEEQPAEEEIPVEETHEAYVQPALPYMGPVYEVVVDGKVIFTGPRLVAYQRAASLNAKLGIVGFKKKLSRSTN